MKSTRWIFYPRRLLHVSLILAIFAAFSVPVSAAFSGPGLVLSSLEIEKFPDIYFYFGAFNENGRFIDDLQPEDIQVVEDDTALSMRRLEKFEPGVQFILSLNTSPVFLNQAGGISAYRKIQDFMVNWTLAQNPGGLNDFSLATNTGLQAIRIDSPEEYAGIVEAYQPNLLTLQPSMVSLSQALDLATDPNPSPLMKRTILYITSLPAGTQLAALTDMGDRAVGLGARIQVWLVGYAGQEKTASGKALKEMAEKTGGEFFMYTGLETFPDLEEELQPLRYIYKAGYTSGIRKSGAHRLVVRVDRADFSSSSEPRSFNLTVAPPNPILISPPSQIQRTWTRPENRKEESQLQPKTYSIEYMVEFPDLHPRDLAFARLLVDGDVVLEETRPPFNLFKWPLAGYLETGRHTLKIQVEDRLGLSRETVEVPVEITVEPAPARFLGGLVSPERMIVAAAVLFTAVVLAVVLVKTSRRARQVPGLKERRAARDPVTQPVRFDREQPFQRSPAVDVKTWPVPEPPLQAPARLVRVIEEGLQGGGKDVLLSHNQITFGSDPNQAIIFLDDPSVSRLHARLHFTPDGFYVLNDAGSVAGTWVNYTPVSLLGVQLKNGDLIHFGRTAFRFEMRSSGEIPQPEVLPYRDDNYDTNR